MTTHVHYIYIGPPPAQSRERRFIWSSPRHRVSEGIHITLWCPRALLNTFKEFIPETPFGDRRNDTRPLEDVVEGLPGEIPGGIQAATKFLGDCGCNSASKDMWSLAVLYAVGGFFLDASTYIIDYAPSTTEADIDVRKFVARFKEDNASVAATTNLHFRPYALSPRFPVLRWIQSPKKHQQQGMEAHTLGFHTSRSGLKLVTPHLEYWAAYANKGDPIILKMLVMYLKNVLVQTRVPTEVNGWSLRDILSRGKERGLTEDKARMLRNVMIGQLISSSVKDGLLESWPGLVTAADEEDVRGSAFGAMTWDAFLYKRHPGPYTKKDNETRMESSRWTRVYLPELGLMKRYEGAWR
jgi:hypothetical protein